MKKLIFAALTFLALAANAKTYEFTCTLDAYKKDGKLLFQLNDIGELEGMTYNENAYTDYEGTPVPFSYEGSKFLEALWQTLLVDFSYGPEKNDKGDIILPIDDVSCDVGKIQLYKNSGYRFGFLNIDHNCGEKKTKTYSKISCSLAEAKLQTLATDPCDVIQEQAETTCRESLCEEWEAEGQECIFEDGGEIALQECASDEFNTLMENYNKTPGNVTLTCGQD